MELLHVDQLLDLAKARPSKKIAVVGADDQPSLLAIRDVVEAKIAIPVLIGDKANIQAMAKKIGFTVSGFEIINQPDVVKASRLAIDLVKTGNADILMKGMLQTATLLHAVLNNEYGIRKKAIVNHFALFESPYYHKLLGVSDAAINISPTLADKVEIIKNDVEIYHKLGIENPKIGILTALELVNPKMEATVEAALLTMMNRRNQIKGCTIDGPFALDNAISKEAARHKNISGEVAGDVDMLLAPDINCGSVLYKAMAFLGGAKHAGIVTGASVPVVLSSRADSSLTKLLSVALAVALA